MLSPASTDSTAVELSAVVERAGLLDALVLLLGGRDWLERRFQGTLTVLARNAARSQPADRRQSSAAAAMSAIAA